MLDTLLKRNDDPSAALRTLYDPYNDEELVLSREELRVLLNIQKGRTPELSVDPYADHIDWYSNELDPFPVSSAPQPKRRFKPSTWEERKIVKLVRLPPKTDPSQTPTACAAHNPLLAINEAPTCHHRTGLRATVVIDCMHFVSAV
jgi:BOP1NT (NUC169) domain